LPTWGELLKELKTLQESHEERPLEFGGASPHDVLRRKYLRELSKQTGRATVVYATSWLEAKDADPSQLQIGLGDVQGFMEAVSNVEERELDLILHSPGGSAEAAESVVEYLRTRFDHIRVFVPVAAMSAATMVALAADEIVMGAHSQLGPIDPQFTIFTPEGPRSAPAQAIKDQFEMAREQCEANPTSVAVWLPILRSYGPGLLAQCDHQRALAEQLVGTWLARYMLADESDPEAKARAVAHWFADFTYFRSHGRRVSRDDARARGLKVTDLEADDALQDAVLSVHHAVMHTTSGTPAVKLIENQHGRAFIQMTRAVFVQQGPPQNEPSPSDPAPRPQVRPRQPRSQRRKRKRK
jgi:hypothetical protein